MRLVIFGASGRTGRHLMEEALRAGHELSAFVRDPTTLDISANGIRVEDGDVLDPRRVDIAVSGQDAVVSALGPRNSRPDDLTTGLQHIIEAMRRHEVRRIVVIGTYACRLAGDGGPRSARLTAWVGRKLIGPDVGAKEDQLRLLRDSGLDWTALRAARLVDGPGSENCLIGEDLKLGLFSKVSRASLARAIMREVEDSNHVGRAPFVMA